MPETDESWVRNAGRVLQQVRDQDCWVGRDQGVWQTPGAPQPTDSEKVRAGRDSGGSLSHLHHRGPGWKGGWGWALERKAQISELPQETILAGLPSTEQVVTARF